MATKEQLVTFVLITFFLFGIAGFNYYLESKIYSEIRLSPGESGISYIFYISLAVIWVIVAIIIFIKNKKDKEEDKKINKNK